MTVAIAPGQPAGPVTAEIIAELESLFGKYPSLQAIATLRDGDIRRDRGRLAARLSAIPDRYLPAVDTPTIRAGFRLLAGLQICHHDLTPSEQRVTDRLQELAGNPNRVNRHAALLTAGLFRPAWAVVARPDLAALPDGVLPWITEFFALPTFLFPCPGDAERFTDFQAVLVDELLALVQARPDAPAVIAARNGWLEWSSFLHTYFCDRNVRAMMETRAALVADYIAREAHRLTGWTAPPRTSGGPIRAGFYLDFLNDGTETAFTLAHYERLPRPEFHVTLVTRTAAIRGRPHVDRAIAAADRYEALPGSVGDAARTLRGLDLDFLFYGANLVARPGSFALHLAALRVARVQVATMCSPTTTGLATMDAFLSSTLIQPPGNPPAQDSYTERLWQLPGAMKQFAMPADRPMSDIRFGRDQVGIPEQAVVLISGANYFKLVPELTRIWMDILAAAPETHLALFPFNPNWSAFYQHEPFIGRLKKEATEAGVALDRITILKPLPHAADTLHYLMAADLYLDSWPYAGAVSMYDPLRLGLPAVAWEGHEARSRQSASILRGLGLTDLIADNRACYVGMVLDLVRDPARRRALADRIARAGAGDPMNEGRDLEARLAVKLREEAARLW